MTEESQKYNNPLAVESTEEVPVTELVDEPVAAVQESQLELIELYTGKFNPRRVRMLCYGDSGVGKTVFGSTWPKPLFLDLDDGMASVTRKVGRMVPKDTDDLYTIADFLRTGSHPFETVVFDSLNELQTFTMRGTVGDFPEVRRAYGNLPSVSDYGKMLYDVEQIIREFKSLDLNVVFLSQSMDPMEEGQITRPQLTGKNSANQICRFMDVVGYIERVTGGSSRQMIFDKAGFMTKDRSNRLPPVVMNPDYQTLLSYWVSSSAAYTA